MNKMFKAAIFMMAMIFSASMAFGQTTTGGSSNPNDNQSPPIPVHVYASSPSESASHATITYRWYDGTSGNWGPWFATTEPFDILGVAHFQLSCGLTNAESIEMEYHIIAYKPHSVQITQTCGTEPIPKSGAHIYITTWNAASCFNIGPIGPIEVPGGGHQY
jgi:hypothetical protein